MRRGGGEGGREGIEEKWEIKERVERKKKEKRFSGNRYYGKIHLEHGRGNGINKELEMDVLQAESESCSSTLRP